MSTPSGSLDRLQRRILEVLAEMEPPWTLVGGGALGFHLHHRTTRDLDLFWRQRDGLGELVQVAQARLAAAGLEVVRLRDLPTFAQFRVSDGDLSTIVDLVSEPFPAIAPAERHQVGRSNVQVAGTQEITASKLCALLGRSELRDLLDLRALLDAGLDLARAVADAPRIDTGFSPLTLSWIVGRFPTQKLASDAGLPEPAIRELVQFRDDLARRLSQLARPAT